MSRMPIEEKNIYPDVVNCFNDGCSFLRKNGDSKDSEFRCINRRMAGKIIRSRKPCPHSRKRLNCFADSNEKANSDLDMPTRDDVVSYIESNGGNLEELKR